MPHLFFPDRMPRRIAETSAASDGSYRSPQLAVNRGLIFKDLFWHKAKLIADAFAEAYKGKLSIRIPFTVHAVPFAVAIFNDEKKASPTRTDVHEGVRKLTGLTLPVASKATKRAIALGLVRVEDFDGEIFLLDADQIERIRTLEERLKEITEGQISLKTLYDVGR